MRYGRRLRDFPLTAFSFFGADLRGAPLGQMGASNGRNDDWFREDMLKGNHGHDREEGRDSDFLIFCLNIRSGVVGTFLTI